MSENIIKVLGYGINGDIYLIRKNNKYIARKTHNCMDNFTNEVNILNKFKFIDGIQIIDSYDVSKLEIDTLYTQSDDLYILKDELTDAEILHIFCRILEIIKEIHNLGYAHRDLKLENVLYNRKTGSVMIIDWEFCIHITEKRKSKLNLYGTISINPPEMFTFNYKDVRYIDIWQIGILMLELLTKKEVFQLDDKNDATHIMKFRNQVINCEWCKKYINGNLNLEKLFTDIFKVENKRCNIQTLENNLWTCCYEILHMSNYIKSKKYEIDNSEVNCKKLISKVIQKGSEVKFKSKIKCVIL